MISYSLALCSRPALVSVKVRASLDNLINAMSILPRLLQDRTSVVYLALPGRRRVEPVSFAPDGVLL
jgi:hypothetical protein